MGKKRELVAISATMSGIMWALREKGEKRIENSRQDSDAWPWVGFLQEDLQASQALIEKYLKHE